jgi:hypothetical protein
MAVHRDADGLGEKPATTVLWSVQNNAAYAAGDAQTPENHLAAVTFDWTNHSVIKSSIRFTPSTNLSN